MGRDLGKNFTQYQSAHLDNPKAIVFVRSDDVMETFDDCACIVERCLGKRMYYLYDTTKSSMWIVTVSRQDESSTVTRLEKMGFSVLVVGEYETEKSVC